MRRRKVYSKLTRRTPSATALPRCRRRDPPYYVPDGDSPLSLQEEEEEEEGLFKTDAVREEEEEEEESLGGDTGGRGAEGVRLSFELDGK